MAVKIYQRSFPDWKFKTLTVRLTASVTKHLRVCRSDRMCARGPNTCLKKKQTSSHVRVFSAFLFNVLPRKL